ncbi:hypothetical protein PQQ81_01070 [Paraburkholderia strydomiana]|uniref:hypothetical protein n=1 Tax=Paraburkholderia strydomiana TaxID=1245417 RepID=UPI0038BC0C00
MNANQIVTLMGGRKAVIEITGLTKGRISQWVNEDHIPAPWLAAFKAMKPVEFAALDCPDSSNIRGPAPSESAS